jgi:hypothetical protein
MRQISQSAQAGRWVTRLCGSFGLRTCGVIGSEEGGITTASAITEGPTAEEEEEEEEAATALMLVVASSCIGTLPSTLSSCNLPLGRTKVGTPFLILVSALICSGVKLLGNQEKPMLFSLTKQPTDKAFGEFCSMWLVKGPRSLSFSLVTAFEIVMPEAVLNLCGEIDSCGKLLASLRPIKCPPAPVSTIRESIANLLISATSSLAILMAQREASTPAANKLREYFS